MRSSMQSAENKKVIKLFIQKEEMYLNNSEILEEKEGKFIQTYCRDLDTSQKCLSHKEKEVEKEK